MSSGIVLVDKPQGWTSHQVVGRMRRLLGTRKVGHAGTLDPMATGLLLIGVNRATRLLGHLAGHDKTYLATIRLGQGSTTDDAEGELGPVADCSGVTPTQIESAMEALRGAIEQVPSLVSAIKVDGQRAYARVRAGEQVELAARPVTIDRFEVTDSGLVPDGDGAQWLDLEVVVDCSSGTYIRALARDLGAALGVGGHLTMLRRTRIGGFQLPPSPLDLDSGEGLTVVPMGEVARASFDWVEVDQVAVGRLGHGQAIAAQVLGQTAAIGPDGDLVALVAPGDNPGWARPTTVFATTPTN